MFDSGKGSKLFLDFADLRSHDPLPALDGCLNCSIERFAEATALSLKVDEGDAGGQQSLRVQITSALLGGHSAKVRHTLYCGLRQAFSPRTSPLAGCRPGEQSGAEP